MSGEFVNGGSGRAPRVLKALVAVNVAVFVLQSLLPRSVTWEWETTFGFSWVGLLSGGFWQPVTYQFLHWNLLHLVVNMLGLWFAGRTLENLLGSSRFLVFYLVAGGVGGFAQVLLTPGSLLIGASGAVCGVVAAFAALYPELRITALLFFVIPLRLKAKWLGYGIIAVSVIFLLTGWMDGIGNAAHLGGALTGYAWVGLAKRRRKFL